MSGKDVLKEALKLKPDERFMLVEGLIKSLDEPDSTLDAIWLEEAERRLNAYRSGELEGIAMEDIFKEDLRKVIFSKLARQELDDAGHYYDAERKGLGERFREEIRKAALRV